MFGQKVEQEFAKRLKNNTTLTRFGYSFQNPGIRMTCANYVTPMRCKLNIFFVLILQLFLFETNSASNFSMNTFLMELIEDFATRCFPAETWTTAGNNAWLMSEVRCWPGTTNRHHEQNQQYNLERVHARENVHRRS